jgi:hypothetical protein
MQHTPVAPSIIADITEIAGITEERMPARATEHITL